jgi:signal transduction histidine kinase
MGLSKFLDSRADDTAFASCRNAWLCCHLSIVALALVLPGGRVGSPPRPFSAADVLVIACVALFIMALGLFHQRGRAALRLAVFWTAVVLTLIIARRVTPAGSPAMAVVFMLGCVVRWRVGVSRARALAAPEAVPQAAATASEPPKLAPAAPDRDAVAQMVHDLRSPLSAVLALVDKQGADKAEAVHHDFLRSVRNQVQYGLSVAQHFMQRSRAERLDRSRFLPVSLQDLAHSAADQVFPLADKKGVSIAVEDGDETLWVAGDYCMLLRAVVNLLENAVKYSASSTRVTLGAQRQGNAARLYVTDQGVGIAAEALPRLCQAFYRAAAARKHCQDGVGMGLAIVAAVAKGHGAEVMVKSRPNQGSTFILTMPLLPRGGALDEDDPPEPGGAAQGAAVRLE